MIRRRRSPLRYLIPALLVGGLLWWAHRWFRAREKPLPPGSIHSVSDAMEEAYGRLGGDFRAKVPTGEFAAMYHRMADPDNETLPAIRQASAFDAAGPEPPKARFRVEYPPGAAKAEYHFARVEGIWKLQSFTRVVGAWRPPRVDVRAPAPSPKPVTATPVPRPPEPGRPPVEPPAPAPTRQFPCHYVIQPGDTLITISRHFYGTGTRWRRIAEANPGLNPRRLKIGRRILIPSLPDHAPRPSSAAPAASADAGAR